MKSGINLGFLPVSNVFIDKYITKANAVFICIYIYSLKKCIEGSSIILKEIADDFNILESDVLNAWSYWKKEGVVDFKKSGDDFFLEFFDLSDFGRFKQEDDFDKNKKNKDDSLEQGREEALKNFKKGDIPDYSVEEINTFRKNDDVKRLFKAAESAFGVMLDFNKMKLVFSFYDWLGMPVDVIEYLIKFCVSNGKGRNLRYIESVAVDWCERGIDSVEKARELVKTFNYEYREIMKAFGISVITPVEAQVKYMEDWINKVPLDLIKEACQRTVMATGKAEFKYADSIIQGWFKNGVRSFDDIKKADLEFNKKKAERKVKDNKSNSSGKPNKFVNYEQRSWDFEALNKLKGELLDKKLRE